MTGQATGADILDWGLNIVPNYPMAVGLGGREFIMAGQNVSPFHCIDKQREHP